ncbi:MAG: hypothetical protein ABR511_12450 [Acidimicrobiales bacterium]
MSVLLLILVVALLLGLLGVLIKGLLWLLFIGILLAVLSLVGIGFRGGRRRPAR